MKVKDLILRLVLLSGWPTTVCLFLSFSLLCKVRNVRKIEAFDMRHSTPCLIRMAISYPKLGNIAVSQISDNVTDEFDAYTTGPTQNHRDFWWPGVFDASLPADVCVTSLSVALQNWAFLKIKSVPFDQVPPLPWDFSILYPSTLMVLEQDRKLLPMAIVKP